MIETTREREFGTPAARVFRALVEPRQLTQWFCDEAEVQLRDGGRYAFGGARAYGGPQTAEGRILRITPDRHLSFIWPLAGVESEVQYDLAERSGRCLITVRHTGVRALPIVAEWPEQHLKVVWDIFLRQLEGYLAGHPVPPMEFPYVPAPVVTHDIIIESPEDRVLGDAHRSRGTQPLDGQGGLRRAARRRPVLIRLGRGADELLVPSTSSPSIRPSGSRCHGATRTARAVW